MKIYERLDMHDRVAFQRLIKNKVKFPEVIKKISSGIYKRGST